MMGVDSGDSLCYNAFSIFNHMILRRYDEKTENSNPDSMRSHRCLQPFLCELDIRHKPTLSQKVPLNVLL
ncbi:MAG: hypothetical protein D3922_17345 [Candidatus Electrothrix sp. AR1]|nr:hypothetical protein [Candidatus Electrothrix sp. AR1]